AILACPRARSLSDTDSRGGHNASSARAGRSASPLTVTKRSAVRARRTPCPANHPPSASPAARRSEETTTTRGVMDTPEKEDDKQDARPDTRRGPPAPPPGQGRPRPLGRPTRSSRLKSKNAGEENQPDR